MPKPSWVLWAGIAFGATFWGKQKTLVQNVTAGTALCHAANFVRLDEGVLVSVTWTRVLTISLMWLTLVATIVSGAAYILDARKLLSSKRV